MDIRLLIVIAAIFLVTNRASYGSPLLSNQNLKQNKSNANSQTNSSLPLCPSGEKCKAVQKRFIRLNCPPIFCRWNYHPHKKLVIDSEGRIYFVNRLTNFISIQMCIVNFSHLQQKQPLDSQLHWFWTVKNVDQNKHCELFSLIRAVDYQNDVKDHKPSNYQAKFDY